MANRPLAWRFFGANKMFTNSTPASLLVSSSSTCSTVYTLVVFFEFSLCGSTSCSLSTFFRFPTFLPFCFTRTVFTCSAFSTFSLVYFLLHQLDVTVHHQLCIVEKFCNVQNEAEMLHQQLQGGPPWCPTGFDMKENVRQSARFERLVPGRAGRAVALKVWLVRGL